jgi:hypothetical protein
MDEQKPSKEQIVAAQTFQLKILMFLQEELSAIAITHGLK